MRMRWFSVLIVAFVLATSLSMDALNVPTHRLVNRAAAGDGTPDDYVDVFVRYLSESLALRMDPDAPSIVNARGALESLAEGGEREDDGSPFSATARFYRHFHNPLLPWNEAGLLTRYPFHISPHQYTSSVHWMQAHDQAQDDGGAAGGTWAWRDARRLQYLVLTPADARRREAYAADLFRALGQIMHLVVDASVPEHVRNDPHPFGTLSREVVRGRTAGNYEYWVSDQQARLGDQAFAARYLSRPIGPGDGLRGLPPPPGEPVATTPVARLIDADRYLRDAPDPNVTVGGPVGLAEVAHANFFSEDTLLGDDPQGRRLPFPSREALVRRTDLAPLNPRVRAYLEKPAGYGLATKFALAECRLEGLAAVLPPYPCVDEAVWEETAAHMLPRAVGYARAVLDYFFRPLLEVGRVYEHQGGTFIEIVNEGDETVEGVFEIFARPGVGTSHEQRDKRAVVNHGAPATIAPGATVSLPIALMPTDQPTAAQLLVFRGRLGPEEDAVAGHVFTAAHVVVAQTAYAADMRESCGSTTQEERYTHTCTWSPFPHIVDGEIMTDPAVTMIAGVSAWAPLAARPSLELDGAPVDWVWRRQGEEPDPRRFRIVFSGNPHGLALNVELMNGTVVSTPLMTMIAATGVADKRYSTGKSYREPPWWVSASRSASLRVTAKPSYRTVSMSGYSNPTSMITNRFGIAALEEHILVRQGIPSEARYSQIWVDYANIYTSFPPKGPVHLEPILKAELDALPFGPPPRGPWEAVIERVYTPAELELLKAFVTAEPPPATFTAVGRPGTR